MNEYKNHVPSATDLGRAFGRVTGIEPASLCVLAVKLHAPILFSDFCSVYLCTAIISDMDAHPQVLTRLRDHPDDFALLLQAAVLQFTPRLSMYPVFLIPHSIAGTP